MVSIEYITTISFKKLIRTNRLLSIAQQVNLIILLGPLWTGCPQPALTVLLLTPSSPMHKHPQACSFQNSSSPPSSFSYIRDAGEDWTTAASLLDTTRSLWTDAQFRLKIPSMSGALRAAGFLRSTVILPFQDRILPKQVGLLTWWKLKVSFEQFLSTSRTDGRHFAGQSFPPFRLSGYRWGHWCRYTCMLSAHRWSDAIKHEVNERAEKEPLTAFSSVTALPPLLSPCSCDP